MNIPDEKEQHFGPCFVTGSTAYGVVDKDSDLDVCVFAWAMPLIRQHIAPKNIEESNYFAGKMITTPNSNTPQINLIPLLPREMVAWAMATAAMPRIVNKQQRWNVFQLLVGTYRLISCAMDDRGAQAWLNERAEKTANLPDQLRLQLFDMPAFVRAHDRINTLAIV